MYEVTRGIVRVDYVGKDIWIVTKRISGTRWEDLRQLNRWNKMYYISDQDDSIKPVEY